LRFTQHRYHPAWVVFTEDTVGTYTRAGHQTKTGGRRKHATLRKISTKDREERDAPQKKGHLALWQRR
jgi:hypothetical protein